MSEAELLDMVIVERISMLLAAKPKVATKSPEEIKQESQAEKFIRNLPEEDLKLMIWYIDFIVNQLAANDPFLYRHGFIDGIRANRFLNNL